MRHHGRAQDSDDMMGQAVSENHAACPDAYGTDGSQAEGVQGSLANLLGLAGAVLAKAEQDSAASARDAKPCCAARVAMSKAVKLPAALHI